MARIRSIKPDFWGDSKLASELTRDQRLFYIGLWNEADDEGRFLAHPRRLLGAIFPYEEDLSESFTEASLKVLSDTGRLTLYSVNGEPYGQLTKFEEHQKINRPSKSRIPSPDSALADAHTAFTESSVKPHVLARAREEQGTGNREQGTGSISAEPKVDSTPNGGGILIHLPTNRKGENYAVPNHQADEWRELYPAVSVDAELRKMRGWLLANADRRKTSRGMPRFIANWLARQQDRGGTGTATPKTKAERLAELQASIERAEKEEAERESA